MENVREFLNRFCVCENEVNVLKESIIQYEGKVEKANGDNEAKLCVQVLRLKKQLEVKVLELEQSRFDILEIINSIKLQKIKRILELRYIDCFEWEFIAEKMGYSLRHTYRLHKKAINMVEEKFNNIEERLIQHVI